MSQTATVVETTENKEKKTRTAREGRSTLLQRYKANTKGKDGKDIHWNKKTIQKRERKAYVKNAVGSTMKRARVSRNFRAALPEAQRIAKAAGIDVPKATVKKSAMETETVVLDGAYNYMLLQQGERCHNYRKGTTAQLTVDTVNRTWNAHGFF